MSEPSKKCENNAIFKQNHTQKLFISFKISYSCTYGLRGNLEFPDFLQFYNINYRERESERRKLRKPLSPIKQSREIDDVVRLLAGYICRYEATSVIRFGDLSDFGQLLKAFGNN